jgi:hypothetical protein
MFALPPKADIDRACRDVRFVQKADIVYESIIDDERRQNTFGLLMSLNMLVETPGGFDYTGADCAGWMKEIGFRRTYVEHW